jgi:hypothetical protein
MRYKAYPVGVGTIGFNVFFLSLTRSFSKSVIPAHLVGFYPISEILYCENYPVKSFIIKPLQANFALLAQNAQP